MKKHFHIREVIKYIGLKSVIAATLVFLLTVTATCVGGYQLYQNTKESILLQGEVNATRAAKEYDSYLIIRETAVDLSGQVVNNMIKEKQPTSVILKYLLEESLSIDTSINKEYTGLYGWICGEYLDGGGWVPDEDYVPTERPWYLETMADNSKITYVKPYLDAQTNTVATTMAMKLCDGTSVMALDVDLERIQEITEAIAKNAKGSYGIVLDDEGQVIAHSTKKELGKNYMQEKGTLGSTLAHEVLSSDKKEFELAFEGRRFMVYTEEIEGGWKSISMVDTEMFYRPLQIILTMLLLFTILEAVVFSAIFYSVSSKNLAISMQNGQIAAIADMYLSIYDIDIPYDSIHEIRRGRDYNMAHVIGENQMSAQDALTEMLDQTVNDSSRPIMEPFIDISTLAQRLENIPTITEEFLDADKRWCRGRFIEAERNKEGTVIRALWMVESIDEEKKHRDTLKYLSETDQMTGLFNRTAGESKITDLLEHGIGGLLLMIDADKFKNINDTLGHDVGDRVIIGIANSINNACRRNSDIVMRLGGDEFIAYAPGVRTKENAIHLINRIFENIVNTMVDGLGDRRVFVSIGAAFCPKDEMMSFSELYKKADLSVYQSKKQVGNTYTFYYEGLEDTQGSPSTIDHERR